MNCLTYPGNRPILLIAGERSRAAGAGERESANRFFLASRRLENQLNSCQDPQNAENREIPATDLFAVSILKQFLNGFSGVSSLLLVISPFRVFDAPQGRCSHSALTAVSGSVRF